MSGDTSEQKDIPATAQKLRKAREQGQVVTSNETVIAISALAGLLYLYATRSSIWETFLGFWTLEIAETPDGFWLALQGKVGILGNLALRIVIPLVCITIATSVFTNLLIAGGPVFSLTRITPDMNKLNPAKGFQNLFGSKALKRFGTNLLRLILIGLVLGMTVTLSWYALIRGPMCGLACAVEALSSVIPPLVISTALILVVMAVFDYVINRESFMEDQKMTKTEFKQEQKDQSGDPQLQGQLRKDRRHMAQSLVGAKHATVIIAAGNDFAIAVHYVPDETPAPIVVAKARGTNLTKMQAQSTALVVSDSALAHQLSKIEVGHYITKDEHIEPLVPHIKLALANTSS